MYHLASLVVYKVAPISGVPITLPETISVDNPIYVGQLFAPKKVMLIFYLL